MSRTLESSRARASSSSQVTWWRRRASRVRGGPGTDAEEIRPVGGIGGVEELPLQGRQRLSFLAHQQAVHEVQEMITLRSGQVEVQRIEDGLQSRRRLYNAREHEGPPVGMGAESTPFYAGGTSCD